MRLHIVISHPPIWAEAYEIDVRNQLNWFQEIGRAPIRHDVGNEIHLPNTITETDDAPILFEGMHFCHALDYPYKLLEACPMAMGISWSTTQFYMIIHQGDTVYTPTIQQK